MVTFLITSVVLLGLVAIAIYLWQKPANQTQTTELPLPPEHGRGLFSDTAEPLELPPAAAVAAEQTSEINENSGVARAHAEALIASFPTSPDRNSTLKMLHLAALADNAEIY